MQVVLMPVFPGAFRLPTKSLSVGYEAVVASFDVNCKGCLSKKIEQDELPFFAFILGGEV